ncbi:hypothetical protein JTB14_012967 [Gonioctena quinquepunctata]|nr:hypothetical protein JTB14_012967 [Gonioctena quinquepunctata]
MEWTKEILTEVIEMYRQRPCLWKIKDKTYLNKNLKMQAYNEILNFLKSRNFENITIKDIKAKLQNLRNAFRKETKKIEDSNRSGAGTEKIYTPTLWYYHLLIFTKDQDTPVESIDNVYTQESESLESMEEDTEHNNNIISGNIPPNNPTDSNSGAKNSESGVKETQKFVRLF